MGIYIENIEIPKNCNHCFVTPGCCPAIRKRIKSDTPGYTWIPANYRHEDCPLVPVQEPHGRLIDTGSGTFPTLHRNPSNDYMHGWNACLKSVYQQPTIIPANEEAE